MSRAHKSPLRLLKNYQPSGVLLETYNNSLPVKLKTRLNTHRVSTTNDKTKTLRFSENLAATALSHEDIVFRVRSGDKYANEDRQDVFKVKEKGLPIEP
jgi:hypothetical protein